MGYVLEPHLSAGHGAYGRSGLMRTLCRTTQIPDLLQEKAAQQRGFIVLVAGKHRGASACCCVAGPLQGGDGLADSRCSADDDQLAGSESAFEGRVEGF